MDPAGARFGRARTEGIGVTAGRSDGERLGWREARGPDGVITASCEHDEAEQRPPHRTSVTPSRSVLRTAGYFVTATDHG